MNIVLVAPDLLGRSGWSRYASELGEELSKRNHKITAIVHKKCTPSWCEEIALLSSPMHYLNNPFLCLYTTIKLQQTLRAIQPDILHFTAEPYALTLRFLKNKGWKTCMTIHGTYAVVPLASGFMTRWLAKHSYKKIDRIFSVSNFTKRYLKKEEPNIFKQHDLESKIHVVPNATNLAHTTFIEKTENTEKYIISVGAVKTRKGYMESVEACAAFDKNWHVPFRYDIFGSLDEDPQYVEALQKRIRELQLDEKIQLRGKVSDEELQQAYKQADLFLLLSRHIGNNFEGFGLVFLEANAWGVPVIGPSTGGCPEAIAENQSGYICEPDNANRVAQRMHAILSANSINRSNCRKWAENHNIQSAVDTIEKEYTSLLS